MNLAGTVKKRRKIAADSSSVILLQKVNLLADLIAEYDLVVAESVYAELVAVPKKGSEELKTIFSDRIARIQTADDMPGMGAGERDTLHLYQQGMCDFVLLDDKKAALFCRRNKIPFVNSLLMPRIFCLTGILEHEECERVTALLAEYGYYSAEIMSKAGTIPLQSLGKFFPT